MAGGPPPPPGGIRQPPEQTPSTPTKARPAPSNRAPCRSLLPPPPVGPPHLPLLVTTTS